MPPLEQLDERGLVEVAHRAGVVEVDGVARIVAVAVTELHRQLAPTHHDHGRCAVCAPRAESGEFPDRPHRVILLVLRRGHPELISSARHCADHTRGAGQTCALRPGAPCCPQTQRVAEYRQVSPARFVTSPPDPAPPVARQGKGGRQCPLRAIAFARTLQSVGRVPSRQGGRGWAGGWVPINWWVHARTNDGRTHVAKKSRARRRTR